MPDDPKPTGEGQQPPTGDATGQQGGNAGAGNGGAGDDKKFTQAELDAHIKTRLEQAQRTAEAKAQKDREAAEAESLKEQSKFKELAEQREKQLAELEPVKAKAERYEAALKAHLEVERQNLPAHITALLDKSDPADQLEWIAANRDALIKAEGDDKAKPPAQKMPNARPNNGKPTAEDDQKAREQSAAHWHSRF